MERRKEKRKKNTHLFLLLKLKEKFVRGFNIPLIYFIYEYKY